MAFDFAKKFPNLFGASPEAEESTRQSEKTEGGVGCSNGGLAGFPFVNYGEQRYKAKNALVLPRPKYTWFAEFDINQDYINSSRVSTNLKTFLQNNNNRLYLNLKRMDHPKPTMAFETLRSYNKYVKCPTKMEYPPAQMTLDDDATSTVIAMWKEYFAFYNHTGDVGFEKLLFAENLVTADEDDAFAYDKAMGTHGFGHLVSSEGTEPRRSMDIRGSMGMRLKPNQYRHFFDRIVLYDLGTEPDSVNVYYYYRPVITAFDHTEADWYDRTGVIEANVTFEYENYYFALGIPAFQLTDVIERVTGVKPQPPIGGDTAASSSEHGIMVEPEFDEVPQTANNNVDAPTPVRIGSNPTPTPFDPPGEPPETPEEIEEQIRKSKIEYQQTLSRECSSTRDLPVCREAETKFQREQEFLNGQLVASQTYYSEQARIRREDPSTADAQRNTESANGIGTTTSSTTDTAVTNAKVQNLKSQREQVQGSRNKVLNTRSSLAAQEALLEAQLLASDEGTLTGEGYDFSTFDPLQREKIEEKLASIQQQIDDTTRQLELIDNRLEQLDRSIANAESR